HRDVRAFHWNWAKRLSEAPTSGAARAIVAEFRNELRERRRVVRDEQNRLRRYAGSNDTDAQGRRLDRREFKETIDALRWVETFQAAWHRNHGGRYREDILTIVGDDFTRRGLPREHGIMVNVAK